jgi:hypothetical protein
MPRKLLTSQLLPSSLIKTLRRKRIRLALAVAGEKDETDLRYQKKRLYGEIINIKDSDLLSRKLIKTMDHCSLRRWQADAAALAG